MQNRARLNFYKSCVFMSPSDVRLMNKEIKLLFLKIIGNGYLLNADSAGADTDSADRTDLADSADSAESANLADSTDSADWMESTDSADLADLTDSYFNLYLDRVVYF